MSEQRGRVRTEPCHKRVRAVVDGIVVADSTQVLLVWERPMYPAYYLPFVDVRAELVENGRTEHSPSRGDAVVCDLVVGDRRIPEAGLRYDTSPLGEIAGHVRLRWDAVHEWLEEDELVYTHPRDPHTRVDILASSRQVRIDVDGVTVAESGSPRILFETGLPPRWYLPVTDVRLELLEPSGSVSHCPYKGQASYWSLVLDGRRYDDFVWCYRSPFAESQKIAGLLCFYNEKVDLYVDGVLQPRPKTHFS
jgi:uncharacterized protein (DUF427 family)